MIIHKPKIVTSIDGTLISAQVEASHTQIPQELWFKVSKEYLGDTSDNYDAFVVALLPIAMHLGVDITIKGTISAKLMRGLIEYQDVLSTWFPQMYKKIHINAKTTQRKGRPMAVASCFSGGVDSFHTLYTNLHEDEGYAITDTLFIHGLEIDMYNKKNFAIASKSHKQLASELKINPLEISTNLLDFGQIIPDNKYGAYMNGTFLVACALIFSKRLCKLYIPSSYDYAHLIKWSTHPMIDHLLSTETLEIVHHGAGLTRTQKTEYVAKIPQSYNRLRVCGVNNIGLQNCGKCEKCLRTMITLEANNDLEKYTTFPHKLSRKLVQKFPVDSHSYLFLKQTLTYVKSKGRKDIAFDIQYALVRAELLNIYIRKWRYVYDISAALKKRSELYTSIIKFIKNDNS